MTEDPARTEVVSQWISRAEQAIASATSEMNAGRLEFAVNRSYYACFYSASAVLLQMGHQFVKHS
ncbi:MAG: HEPN domain-containing protein [Thermoanaerobaculia bacterium]